jgi:hypothetical protein
VTQFTASEVAFPWQLLRTCCALAIGPVLGSEL